MIVLLVTPESHCDIRCYVGASSSKSLGSLLPVGATSVPPDNGWQRTHTGRRWSTTERLRSDFRYSQERFTALFSN